jgi:hypothetical protein
MLSGRSPPRAQGAQDSRFGGGGSARRITPEGRLVFVLVDGVAAAVVGMSGGRTTVAACTLAAGLVLGGGCRRRSDLGD